MPDPQHAQVFTHHRFEGVAIALQGIGAIAMCRKMMGATNAAEAEPGTIRGDLSATFTENLVHGSDSAESAEPTESVAEHKQAAGA